MSRPEKTPSPASSDREPVQAGMAGLLGWVSKTLPLRTRQGRALLPIGYFANVIDLDGVRGLAISTDGVGTKLLVAQLLDRYDTIGIDCVAMNVNDVLCVGAEPLTLVDYLAVERLEERLLEQIGHGLFEGARRAGVTIVGGEVAQMPSVIRGERSGFGFDLAATCVGLVAIDRLIDGSALVSGDLLIGLPSSGIHSNGLTMARRILFEEAGLDVESHVPELGRALGEELLEPTTIYVREVLDLLAGGIEIHALAHITGDGLLNLSRVAAPRGFLLDDLPEPQPLFLLIQQLGRVPDDEMYRIFNMGIGFCLAVPPGQASLALQRLRQTHPDARVIGRAVDDPKRAISLVQKGLTLRP